MRRRSLLRHSPLQRTSFQFLAKLEWVQIAGNLYHFSSGATEWLVLKNGGDDGNRTHDPLLAGQVLSQLSYTPVFLQCPRLFLFPMTIPLIPEN